ncbi:hypothetical protein HK414_19035 [Ramlibacter terrae]|uniref:PAC domain-containing protein n=1 Tax=Ramlibacter terrae TaxID=2732511 RepID=A0ABX6P618_9BURK|nr:hypothetical protein HK414_19035 [Ramlibacter terrae]
MQGSVAEVKVDLRRKDGRAIPVMLNAVERHWDGQQMLHASVFRAEDRHKYERELLLQRRRAEDLAARHGEGQRALALAQQRLRLALESADLYGWDIDPATGERRYEDAVGRLLGLPPNEHVDAAGFLQAIAPDDRPGEAAAPPVHCSRAATARTGAASGCVASTAWSARSRRRAGRSSRTGG